MDATECVFCGDVDARMNTPHWTGSEYVRVQVCVSPACRTRVASAPRRPRRKRTPVIVDRGGCVNLPGLSRLMLGKQ